MTQLVIYHAGCWDGFCAAWLFKKAYPSAEFHAAHYGTPPPDVTGKEVYIVDFSYPRQAMLSLISQAQGNVTVLDHHKTAEKELAGIETEVYRDTADRLPEIVFDMTKSGGRLAWEYLCRTDAAMGSLSGSARKAPWLVDYTEDRDLWRHKLDWTQEINAYIRSFPLDFKTWDDFAIIGPGCEKWDTWVDAGSAIRRREAQIVQDHTRHAREIEMGGHKILSVNATVLFSEVAGELAKDRPFGACYFDRFDGKRQWSLRSDPNGIDVSEIAKANGGGGHKSAAGFEQVIDPLGVQQ